MDLSSFRLPASKRLPLASQGYLRTSLSQFGSFPKLSGLSIAEPKGDDAVEVKLSARRNVTATNAEEVSAELSDVQAIQKPSGVRSLLGSLSRIVSRIDSLKTDLAKAPISSRQAEDIEKELEALQEQYDSFVQGDDFKHLSELTAAISDSINRGASYNTLADSLAAESGFLGSDFISRVRSGDLANIQRFTSNLSTILDPSNGNLLSSEGKIGTVKAAITDALKSLDGVEVKAVEPVVAAPTEARILPPPPIPAEVAFKGAGNVALALRSFQGEDAIQAAFAHVEFDPRTVLTLTSNDDPEDEEEKERLKKKEDEKRDTRLNRSLTVEKDPGKVLPFLDPQH